MRTPRPGPVLVLAALDLEYEAVRNHLTELTIFRKEGTLFERGRLPGGGDAVLALIGAGNLGAAALTERAREAFSPRVLLMVGVAGALKDDIELGDIVVAEKIYAYHGAKAESADHLARPTAWEADHELLQLAHHISREKSWTRYLVADSARRQPTVHFKPVAAGEVVLNSRESPLARQLHSTFNDAAAIEMESSGIAKAGGLSRSLPVLTIRGISDRADGVKQAADRAGSQPAAAANAAAFALALAVALHTDIASTPDDTQPQSGPMTQFVLSTGGTSYNVLGGNLYNHPGPPATSA